MTHGGKRLNAGPKLKYGISLNRTIRVPESWVVPIKNALASQRAELFAIPFAERTLRLLRYYEHQLIAAKRSPEKHRSKLAFSIAERLIHDLTVELKRLI